MAAHTHTALHCTTLRLHRHPPRPADQTRRGQRDRVATIYLQDLLDVGSSSTGGSLDAGRPLDGTCSLVVRMQAMLRWTERVIRRAQWPGRGS